MKKRLKVFHMRTFFSQAKPWRNRKTKEYERENRPGRWQTEAGKEILASRRGAKKAGALRRPCCQFLRADYSAVSIATLMTPSCRLPKSR